jgi:hypothetical protein
MAKYSEDGDFTDPVVRCDSCQRLLLVAKLKELGACICGSRKVKNVRGFESHELEAMQKWGVDPEFLALFEPVDGLGVGGMGVGA